MLARTMRIVLGVRLDTVTDPALRAGVRLCGGIALELRPVRTGVVALGALGLLGH